MLITENYEDLVYDVGMHKGEDTDYYLKKGFRVIAFEADPDLVSECKNRFVHEIRQEKLTIVEGAITECSPNKVSQQKIQFYKNKNVTEWGTVVADWAQRNERIGTSSDIIEVSVIDFTECLKRFGIPHYLKIDLEGMDVECLKCLSEFKHRPDYVSIESEKVSYDRLLDELNLLIHLGYTNFKAVQQSSVPNQMEPNPSKEGTYAGYQFDKTSSGLFGTDLPFEWKNIDQIRRKYKYIFLKYKLFGDDGVLRKYYLGRKFIKYVIRRIGRPFPGWYDTHARHSSIAD